MPFDESDDLKIRQLHSEGLGIRSISRILGYSPATIIRRILRLRALITKPIYHQNNQTYEVDELWTFVGKKHPANYYWVIYAINQKTYEIIDVVIGLRNKKNLKQVIDVVKLQNPKKIITDKLITYPKLILPIKYNTNQYANTRIERINLTLRTHLKRLNRRTICFSKSIKMLEASIVLYFDARDWKLKIEK
ncbi:MAG: IS1 family transposase [Flavobacteriia bacterium]|nr:IS1 family transposase [Flavobacteriia bacterium]